MPSRRTTTWPTRASPPPSSSPWRSQRPLLLEGEAGVGKTEVAKVLARWTGGELLRLQCYEGIDVAQAVYEWDYSRQLLHLRAAEAAGRPARRRHDGARGRALLRAVPRAPAAAAGHRPTATARRRCCSSTRSTGPTTSSRRSCSRSCPTTRSPSPSSARSAPTVPPIVVITSNRTRDVHDALKRRCLYHWVEHPDFEREVAIVRAARARTSPRRWPARSPAAVEALRELGLYKPPGVAETIDWAQALAALGPHRRSTSASVDATLGTVLKYREDQERVRRTASASSCEAASLAAGDRGRGAATRASTAAAVGLRPACCARRGPRRPGRQRGRCSPRRSARSASSRRGVVYWAGRATLVRRPEDIAAYDRAFAAFWRAAGARAPIASVTETESPSLLDDDDDDGAGRRRARGRRDRRARRADRALQPRTRCCATRTSPPTRPAELAEAAPAHGRPAPGRRAAPVAAGCARSRRPTGRPDLRRTVRPALRTGGEPVRRRYLRARRAAPPAGAARATSAARWSPTPGRCCASPTPRWSAGARVEAFALGTRLTRLTRELSVARSRRALAAAAGRRSPTGRAAPASVRACGAFNDRVGRAGHGPRRGRRDPVRRLGPGRPGVLAEQMARLRRVAHRVVWVNPLKASPGYEPLARGMAAALPYVDEFVEGHSLAVLEELADVIVGLDGHATMKEILDDLDRWRAAGQRVALARVVDIEGSGPRDPGAAMAVNEDGEVAGSVSGGCVEGAVVDRGARRPRDAATGGWSPSATATTRRSPSASPAAAPSTSSSSRSTGERRAVVRRAARRRCGPTQPVALATVIEGPDRRRQAAGRARPRRRSGTLGDPDLDRVVARDALGELAAGRTGVRHYGEHGEASEDDGGGLHRVVRAAAADADLRRRRLHRRAGPGGQGPRLPGHRVRRPRGVRHPAPLPDGRRGRRRLAPPPARARRRRRSGPATRCACSPTTPSSTCRPSSAALAHRRRLPRRHGQPAHPRRAASSACARRASTTPSSARIMAPIGLDIGARTPEETAVADLRRDHRPAHRPGHPVAPRHRGPHPPLTGGIGCRPGVLRRETDRMLTDEQRWAFERTGILRLEGAFGAREVARMADVVWNELHHRYDIIRDDPTTWDRHPPTGLRSSKRSRAFESIQPGGDGRTRRPLRCGRMGTTQDLRQRPRDHARCVRVAGAPPDLALRLRGHRADAAPVRGEALGPGRRGRTGWRWHTPAGGLAPPVRLATSRRAATARTRSPSSGSSGPTRGWRTCPVTTVTLTGTVGSWRRPTSTVCPRVPSSSPVGRATCSSRMAGCSTRSRSTGSTDRGSCAAWPSAPGPEPGRQGPTVVVTTQRFLPILRVVRTPAARTWPGWRCAGTKPTRTGPRRPRGSSPRCPRRAGRSPRAHRRGPRRPRRGPGGPCRRRSR